MLCSWCFRDLWLVFGAVANRASLSPSSSGISQNSPPALDRRRVEIAETSLLRLDTGISIFSMCPPTPPSFFGSFLDIALMPDCSSFFEAVFDLVASCPLVIGGFISSIAFSFIEARPLVLPLFEMSRSRCLGGKGPSPTNSLGGRTQRSVLALVILFDCNCSVIPFTSFASAHADAVSSASDMLKSSGVLTSTMQPWCEAAL
mmetsp:Transcript_2699/g.5365  ORF Transcript_2699/g.5365 Transcript_2699/m.5365 type:complete len:203 (+) Transcript_2699:187-795(+)